MANEEERMWSMQPVTNGIRRYNNEIKDEKLDSVDGTAKRN